MDVNVPEKLSRLPFSSDPRSNLAAGGSKQFDRDTVFFFKVQSEGVTHASGHIRNHRYLAFFLRGSEVLSQSAPTLPGLKQKSATTMRASIIATVRFITAPPMRSTILDAILYKGIDRSCQSRFYIPLSLFFRRRVHTRSPPPGQGKSANDSHN